MTPSNQRPSPPSPTSNTDALRSRLIAAFRQSLDDLAPRRLVREHLRAHPCASATTLVAVGKAAPAMAEGAAEVLHPLRGIVVTTDATPCPQLPPGIDVMRASHPVPDARSLHAADSILRMAASIQRDHLLVLVSGGASSLICAPVHGLALSDKQRITQSMLRSGANIRQVNTVRRHLSRIKGGKLALAANTDVTCLLISDVIGGAPHDVGSGPACADPTTVDDARAVLRGVLSRGEADRIENHLVESLSPADAAARRVHVVSLAGPAELAARLRAHLQAAGFSCASNTIVECTAEALSKQLVSHARALHPGSAVVFAAEPTVALSGPPGSGGRAGWIALRVWAHLPPDTALLAAASDGVDGNSGGGGACVGGDHAAHASSADALLALARFDDASVHRRSGTQLDGTPTGANMTDVYVVARARTSLSGSG